MRGKRKEDEKYTQRCGQKQGKKQGEEDEEEQQWDQDEGDEGPTWKKLTTRRAIFHWTNSKTNSTSRQTAWTCRGREATCSSSACCSASPRCGPADQRQSRWLLICQTRASLAAAFTRPSKVARTKKKRRRVTYVHARLTESKPQINSRLFTKFLLRLQRFLLRLQRFLLRLNHTHYFRSVSKCAHAPFSQDPLIHCSKQEIFALP